MEKTIISDCKRKEGKLVCIFNGAFLPKGKFELNIGASRLRSAESDILSKISSNSLLILVHSAIFTVDIRRFAIDFPRGILRRKKDS
jgi:hypothetical protein